MVTGTEVAVEQMNGRPTSRTPCSFTSQTELYPPLAINVAPCISGISSKATVSLALLRNLGTIALFALLRVSSAIRLVVGDFGVGFAFDLMVLAEAIFAAAHAVMGSWHLG